MEIKGTQIKNKSWDKYPLETKVFSISGGYWIKKKEGWQWLGKGDIFPTPAADAFEIKIPNMPV